MTATVTSVHLDTRQRAAIEVLAEQAAQADGVQPLNEAAMLALAPTALHPARHWVATVDEQIVGYAQLDPQGATAQLVVAPAARRRGVGRELVDAVLAAAPDATWWSFGNTPAAQALAAALGWSVTRELLIMASDLDGLETVPQVPGFSVASLADEPDIDRAVDELVSVNRQAFAHHPEQGAMSAGDVRQRMQLAWFDAAGLLLARDGAGRLVGFHWTKVTPDQDHPDGPALGEVYVIGVLPEMGGRGLGRHLLAAGLRHLSDRGVRRVQLYVEASEQRAVQLYSANGFSVVNRDLSYTARHPRPGGSH